MALTSALNLALTGIADAQRKIAVTSGNITNAETQGYTSKTLQSRIITTPFATFPAGGQVVGSRDPFLEAALIEDLSAAGRARVIAESLTLYQQTYGTTGGGSFTISEGIDQLNADLLSLAALPTDLNRKYTLVETAELLTSEIRDIQDTIQNLREQAENKIDLLVQEMNTTLDAIRGLNSQISSLNNTSAGNVGDLEDRRLQEMNRLSEIMNVKFFYTENNEVRIFTNNGTQLVGATNSLFQYTKTPSINKDVTYPGIIGGITYNGVDFTSLFTGGELSGLIQLRDTTYVQESAKLDQFATQIINTVNAASNQGTSLPARETLLGDTSGLLPGDILASAGTFRVSTVDSGGNVVTIQDINLGPLNTVADIVAAINGVPGVNAALVGGQLQVTSAVPGNGVAFNEMNSAVGPDGFGLSHYFGMNNFFNGTDSRDIGVSQYLRDDPTDFPSAFLNGGVLAIGDLGLAIGDNTNITTMANSFTNENVSFAAAGNFVAQTSSLSKYANNLISNAATQASNAQITADATEIAAQGLRDTLEGKTGVNVDEETARLLQFENQYQSAALVIQTVKNLFETLISVVR